MFKVMTTDQPQQPRGWDSASFSLLFHTPGEPDGGAVWFKHNPTLHKLVFCKLFIILGRHTSILPEQLFFSISFCCFLWMLLSNTFLALIVIQLIYSLNVAAGRGFQTPAIVTVSVIWFFTYLHTSWTSNVPTGSLKGPLARSLGLASSFLS